MADNITGITRGGTAWTPEFAIALDPKKCIGCGRCYKVCTRDVLELIDRSEDELADDDADDNDDGDSISSVMALAHPMDCTGCAACSRVCPKACFTHRAMPLGA